MTEAERREAYRDFARNHGAVAFVTGSGGLITGLAPMDPLPDGFILSSKQDRCVPDRRTTYGKRLAREMEELRN
jgi:hypothetical protein